MTRYPSISFTAYRLRQLEDVSRRRALTEHEQDEVVRLAQRDRRNRVVRERYASDPAYRRDRLSRIAARRAQ